MSDPVIIIGGGPRPGATIYTVSRMEEPGNDSNEPSTLYEIRDGQEILVAFAKLSYAQALLPLIQRGD